MIAKRVIPCLDVHDGQVTRGVRFGKAEAGELRNVGDPVELAIRYNEQGADEMVFFDITASAHGRQTMVSVIERAADQCFMPLTVGGGLRTVADMHAMLKAGADKISINSSALATPDLIRARAPWTPWRRCFGRQSRRRAGGEHFSLWRIHRWRRETISGTKKHSRPYDRMKGLRGLAAPVSMHVLSLLKVTKSAALLLAGRN